MSPLSKRLDLFDKPDELMKEVKKAEGKWEQMDVATKSFDKVELHAYHGKVEGALSASSKRF